MASEWLRIMLEEIARKQDDARRGQEEEQRRKPEAVAPTAPALAEVARGTPKIS